MSITITIFAFLNTAVSMHPDNRVSSCLPIQIIDNVPKCSCSFLLTVERDINPLHMYVTNICLLVHRSVAFLLWALINPFAIIIMFGYLEQMTSHGHIILLRHS